MSDERRLERHFAALEPPESHAKAEAEAITRAWARLRARREVEPAPRAWRPRPAWLGAAACALLATTLGLSPAARSATVRVLALFRLQQVTAVPVDVNGNAPLANRSTASLIQRLFADDATVTQTGHNQLVPSGAAAAQLTGFSPRYPGSLPNPQFFVEAGREFSLTVDRSRVQMVLDAAGVSTILLPPSLDGATVSVRIPPAVSLLYGDCASWLQRNATGLPTIAALGGCTALGEVPSPTASLPPGLDMSALAAVGLQLTGMSASAAQQFCSTIDWTSTLVVPFPRRAANARDVTVDGASGVLLTTTTARAPQYVLLWARGGMLYSIAGAGDGSQGLTLAAALPPA